MLERFSIWDTRPEHADVPLIYTSSYLVGTKGVYYLGVNRDCNLLSPTNNQQT